MAFTLAASLHVAVAIASRHDQVPSVAPFDGQPDVTAVDLIDPPAPTTIPETSSVPAPPENRDSEFVEEYAQMSQSTGNAALDQATLSALRCWRFKPGLYSVVRALSGAQF